MRPETDLSEDVAEALFRLGCDDCTPAMSNGVPLIYFHREAVNSHEAIRSAVAAVQEAGCKRRIGKATHAFGISIYTCLLSLLA